MPTIDLSLIGATKGPVVTEYSWKDAALYALACGAGPQDLPLVYEANPGGMKVLPGFVVVPAYSAWPSLGDVQWPLMLHGQQIITLHRAIPPSAKLVQTGRVGNILDKGKGALIQVTVSGSLESGEPLYEAQWDLFYLGAGGFGGERGASAELVEPPDAPPDWETTCRVAPNAAALYRLLGDVNPLHIDPQASAQAGLDRPILHGLCTYGHISRAMVCGLLDGEPARLGEFSARFAQPVFPGDELTIQVWRDGGDLLVEARTMNGKVLKNGHAKLR